MNEELKVIISAEVSKLKSSVGEAKKEIKSFKQQVADAKSSVDGNISKLGQNLKIGFAAIGAGATAAAAGVYKLATDSASSADEIDKMSQKIGISREAYQEWRYVLGQSGVDVAVLKNGVKTLTTQMDSAKGGSKKAQEAFKALGLTWEDGSGKLKSQEQMLQESIIALAGMKDGTERARLAQQLFGRAGVELAPVLNSGKEGIEQLKDRCHELGLIMSDESVNAGVKFGDTMDDVKQSIGAAKDRIGAELLPILQTMADKFLEIMPSIESAVSTAFDTIKNAIEFVKQNQGLFAALATAIGVVVAAIGLYNAVAAVKMAMDAAQVASIGALIAAKLASAAASAAALAPYALIVAAIAAVIAIIVVCVKHWDQIKEATKKAFDKMKETVSNGANKIIEFFKKIFNWIKDNWKGLLLLIVNPFAGAFKLAYDNCSKFREKVNGFVEKVKGLFKSGFEAVKTHIITPISNAKDRALTLFETLKTNISTKVSAIKTSISNVFSKVKDAITKPVETAKEKVKALIDKIKGFFNFSWSLPKLKMPHLSISGKFSINPPSVPKFSIQWYKLGGVFDKTTLFPYGGGSIGGLGEDGAEAIVPLEKNTKWLDIIAEKLSSKQGGNRPIVLQVDGKTFAEISVDSINDLTRLRGSLPLKLM